MPPRPASPFGLLFSGLYTVYATAMFCINTFVLICPLILVLPGVGLRRRIASFGVRLGMLLMGVPFRVRGSDNLPAGPCIVVSNHASYLDGLVMTAALPARFNFVIQHGAAKWFYAGTVLRRLGYRFVNRSSARAGAVQTRALLRDLRAGESLAIFAEGTFKAEPGLLPFKNGAFLLAAKTSVPVVPVTICGTRRLLGGGTTRFRWSRVSVDIGRPLPVGGHAPTLRDAARAAILAQCGEPDAQAPAAADEAMGEPIDEPMDRAAVEAA
ncbi:lysophospholipid acyltransferase family protein [Hydrocarboniphaga sp.]|uniref:lysophospholipid acyltransferase family protein n=1 Tax=Hydrocarboniphaga sp. TaxID=2033016 RepID=UPI00260BA544|nr:lysophospholipid acyltransferase family protein [Hydrocarboniphaga sp.]